MAALGQFYDSVRSVLCQFYVRGYAPGAAPVCAGQREGRAVEGLDGQAQLFSSAALVPPPPEGGGRRGRPVKTQGDFRGVAREAARLPAAAEEEAGAAVGASVAAGRLALCRCPSSHYKLRTPS